ncbi:MAG: hypothetical protein FWF52_09070 [Candidatus Azobacteroides sp.]|nr:hypothetical protein [Candidatus Azobacteroides sp.]
MENGNSKIRTIAENLLGRHLTEKDGMSIPEIETVENACGMKLPTALRDFYLLVGNLELFTSSFEQFIEPYIKDKMLIFLEENQGVCYWGINIRDTENETVFQCTDIESDDPEGHSEEVTLTDFLIILLYYQCAQGGYEYGSAVYESNFDSRENYMQFLVNITVDYKKVVEHNELVVYQNGGKLIWHFSDEKGNLADAIFASTRTEEDMKELEIYRFRRL